MSDNNTNDIIKFQYNNATNVTTDNALAAILPKFSIDYIMGMIDYSIDHKFRPFDQQNIPNLVFGFETQFKYLMDGFPSNQDELISRRQDTYVNILDVLCSRFNLEWSNADEIDIYNIAYYLYDFLIAKFTPNIVTFFTNYIIINKSSLITGLDNDGIESLSMIYSKKIFFDNDLSTIHANINRVLYDIGSHDIDIYDILNNVYSGNPEIANLLGNVINDKGNYFKNFYYSIIENGDYSAELQTMIKLQLQTVGVNIVSVDD